MTTRWATVRLVLTGERLLNRTVEIFDPPKSVWLVYPFPAPDIGLADLIDGAAGVGMTRREAILDAEGAPVRKPPNRDWLFLHVVVGLLSRAEDAPRDNDGAPVVPIRAGWTAKTARRRRGPIIPPE